MSAICGGNREYAEQILEKDGHCKAHDHFTDGCIDCHKVYIELIDANFMALMREALNVN